MTLDFYIPGTATVLTSKIIYHRGGGGGGGGGGFFTIASNALLICHG